MDLEAELNQLFRSPIEGFVVHRNDLVKRLKAAGRGAEADAVRALQRPTPPAWAVNQLAYDEPALLEAVRDAAARVRNAQESSGEATEIVEANRARVEARRRAEQAARRHLATASKKPSAAQERLIAALLDAHAAGTLAVAPGRLVGDVEAVGFEAFEAVAAPPKREKPTQDAPGDGRKPNRTKTPARTDQRAELAALVDSAAKRARELEADMRRAGARVDRATRDAAEAERRLAEARTELEEAETEAARARAELGEARGLVARARRELETLRR